MIAEVLQCLFDVVTFFLQFPLSFAHTLSDWIAFLFPFSIPDSYDSSNNSTSSEFNFEDPIESIIDAKDIVGIVGARGYGVHEHVIRTKDGYLLTIHRIFSKYKDEKNNENKPVVYFHHGLLTNSELFVLGETASKCLPFVLVDMGFDVWLGNNRGNKYSRKHVSISASTYKFWDFSLDEFALYDIPNTIDYILNTTGEPSLSYIGFSQGSAQGIAALSLSPRLNKKVNQFIGLSPAMIPKGLNHNLAKLFLDSSPSLLFRLFGSRAILPSVVFWQHIFGPNFYRIIVDNSITLLFGWKCQNICFKQKRIGYQHMFSPCSVKSVVHWFQIIKNKRFQMYDEGGNAGSILTSVVSNKAHRIAPFPVQNITTPCFLIYGKSDILVDIDKTLQNMNSSIIEVLGIETYEHMDTLWANDVEDTVFEPVLEKLTTIKNTRLNLFAGLKHREPFKGHDSESATTANDDSDTAVST